MNGRGSQGRDVWLGSGVRGGGAVRAVDAGAADSVAGSKPVCGVRELPNQWCICIDTCHYLLCSQLYLLVSYWRAHVHGIASISLFRSNLLLCFIFLFFSRFSMLIFLNLLRVQILFFIYLFFHSIKNKCQWNELSFML